MKIVLNSQKEKNKRNKSIYIYIGPTFYNLNIQKFDLTLKRKEGRCGEEQLIQMLQLQE